MFMIRRVGVGGARKALAILVCVIFAFFIIYKIRKNREPCKIFTSHDTMVTGEDGKSYKYDRNSPFIFIGGFPRSGTTLVRAMLDAHEDVRCGQETRVIPRILELVSKWKASDQESNRLREAGVTEKIIGDAVASFILDIVVKHGEPAPRLCNKDPFTLKFGVYLSKLFPQAKFIFMIRDGRAVVHSIITRKIRITGFDLNDYEQCLTKWSNSTNTMLRECDALGDRCLKVKYEDLVLHPRSQMERLLDYLGLPWTEEVLHHEKYINKPGGITLSKSERSTDQVLKPVNVEALSKWVDAIPDDVVQDMNEIAPMLKVLGYDPEENVSKYGQQNSDVAASNNKHNPKRNFHR